MIHHISVIVETDDTHLDAPTATELVNEIQSHLEWDAYQLGINRVEVTLNIQPLEGVTPRD